MGWLDRIPLFVLVLLAVVLGLAPFTPQPHVVEKLVMLSQERLVRPVDVFDLALHGTPWILLALKLARSAGTRAARR